MKKLMLLAAGIVASFAMVGCKTVPTLTFQQQVSLACADAKTAVQIMTDDGVFTGGALDTLDNKFTPALSKVCAAGVTVTTPNLQALVDTGLPLLKSLVDSSTLAQQYKNDANAAIDVTILAINTAIALQPAPVVTPAPAASSVVVAGL